jgi:hypothetical protein
MSYRSGSYQTRRKKRNITPAYDKLFAWIKERYAIKVRREAGQSWPWSDDLIFQQNFFCSVHREDDKVTQWVRDNWRNPHAEDPDLWFALLVARRALNNPDSMAELGYPVPWDPKGFLDMCKRREAAKLSVFRQQAYKVLVADKSGKLGKLLVKHVLDPAWKCRRSLRPRSDDTLWSFHKRLLGLRFMGGFWAGQVVDDLKFVQLRGAPDRWDYAVSGPGSRRGLTRLLGGRVLDPKADVRMAEDFFACELQKTRHAVDPMVAAVGIPRLDASDMQGALCELDKYERIRTRKSTGRRYRPGEST